MRIIIAGAGVVGYSLAEYLSEENHTISVIENNRKVCNQLQEKLDVMVINGTAISPTILEESGIQSADMVIAVTPDDSKNILICGLARQFNVEKRIARIRSEEYINDDSVNLFDLGVTDVIDPEQVVVDSIMHRLETPGALDATNFQEDSILLRSYVVEEDMPIVGKTLMEIRKMSEPSILLIVAVIRGTETIIPYGSFKICVGDKILSLLPKESLPTLLKLVNKTIGLHKKVIISGDNLIAVQLASKLEKIFDQVILVDMKIRHCEQAAAKLLKTEVLHGDATETDLLNEIVVKNANYFIGAGSETEHNMMSCLLAKALGNKEIICVCHQPKHDNLLYSIGIDYVVNPRVTIAREILERVMYGHIGAAIAIRNVDLDVLRIKAGKDSYITKSKLSEIWQEFHSEAIVGAVIRDGKMIIPSGETVVAEDDYVIILTLERSLDKVKALFEDHETFITKVKNMLPGV